MGFRLNRLFGPIDRIICLTEPIDLEAVLRQFEGTWYPQTVESFRIKVARQVVIGDELWDCHTSGFQRRRGLRGLALVRRGRVAKIWWIWKS